MLAACALPSRHPHLLSPVIRIEVIRAAEKATNNEEREKETAKRGPKGRGEWKLYNVHGGVCNFVIEGGVAILCM